MECTFYGNRGELGGAICASWCGLTINHTIIAFSTWGEAVWTVEGCVALSCCDLYGNAGGDWVDGIADQYGVRGNISADPLFCDPGGEDFHLQDGSPCAPDHNPDCGLIGAWPVGCGGTPVEVMSWGTLKALYR